MRKTGRFCEIYGKTLRNRVIEYLMENQDIDFAIGDMSKEINISRPKAYQIMGEFEKKGYVKRTRIVGKTQLFALNHDNKVAKIFLRNFEEIINSILDEYSQPDNKIKQTSNAKLIGTNDKDINMKVEESFQNALSKLPRDINCNLPTSAIVYVIGGADMTLDATERAVRAVAENLPPKAKINWGARVAGNIKKPEVFVAFFHPKSKKKVVENPH
ncbi:MAG: hypothetical protein V1702_03425 [Candidatus Woesearchaeota archaeon]